MTVASVAITSSGISARVGASRKNGLLIAAGLASSSAPAEVVQHQRRRHRVNHAVRIGFYRSGPYRRTALRRRSPTAPPCPMRRTIPPCTRGRNSPPSKGSTPAAHRGDAKCHRCPAAPMSGTRSPSPARTACRRCRCRVLDRKQRGQHQQRERHDKAVQLGAIICSPSMAESTEMAGVITPSP